MHRALRCAAAAALLGLAVTVSGCANGTARGEAATVRVYAAASLAAAFDRIAEEFAQAHPDVGVSVVSDGSTTLARQIAEGAPADVFAAADEAALRLAGPALRGQVFATNRLVLAVPAANPAGITGLADLPGATVVLCAPEVPCGAASAELLRRADVEVTPASVEQNVTAVLTKVAAGEADAGLVYATDVRGNDDVRAIVPALAAEVVSHYPIAVLPDAGDPEAAAAFVGFVRSAQGRSILADFGFGAP
ncbi:MULTISPECIES: molybdate ABC transporter substrate-binding protein [Microbacterium]|uniref:Molybdate ABC transporter substrate-binding protein n=1 Tax=Microbacterium wangchenii TaxID=2541726 RepID=A0ABX5SX62_9MICO|nr:MULTISPECIES: molybdate ABC transporter substrate-binding protein [Microbacterium]MCK6067378.1 molybdate ABC transporter substrate-binding protein [Microbacterium sp. EYE_512]QBR89683.1 molybdate ABC transporter substrate-binding protein [Microbacterium wangchenii]TXK16719.1 molybdate ABC transporter substrate-binding protein [Microbacterium wangchenii]